MSYLIDFFKLTSDETRLRIIILLAQEELCVCEICGILNLTQPKVSKHLSKLRDMRFVVDERREKFIFYSLNLKDETIKIFVRSIVDHIDEYQQLSKDSKSLADKEVYLSQCQTKPLDQLMK